MLYKLRAIATMSTSVVTDKKYRLALQHNIFIFLEDDWQNNRILIYYSTMPISTQLFIMLVNATSIHAKLRNYIR